MTPARDARGRKGVLERRGEVDGVDLERPGGVVVGGLQEDEVVAGGGAREQEEVVVARDGGDGPSPVGGRFCPWTALVLTEQRELRVEESLVRGGRHGEVDGDGFGGAVDGDEFGEGGAAAAGGADDRVVWCVSVFGDPVHDVSVKAEAEETGGRVAREFGEVGQQRVADGERRQGLDGEVGKVRGFDDAFVEIDPLVAALGAPGAPGVSVDQAHAARGDVVGGASQVPEKRGARAAPVAVGLEEVPVVEEAAERRPGALRLPVEDAGVPLEDVRRKGLEEQLRLLVRREIRRQQPLGEFGRRKAVGGDGVVAGVCGEVLEAVRGPGLVL
mmetsp:Transcript_18546/g.56989  ORF Transcript_18546/g.56989 Transcript_18546/m.56989 type:complete len:330 (+) Transcript_18546:127-1116(+)